MSEFSKLAARLEIVSEAVLKIDSNYTVKQADSTHQTQRIEQNDQNEQTIKAAQVEGDEKNQMDISDIVSLSQSTQSSAASHSMSTTTSATPDFRSQWAWRSTSSAVATDKEQYLSVEGKQLIADYDIVQKLRDELTVKLIPACEQFVAKAAKDALTDTPRFGIAMRGKMTSASERSLSTLKLTVSIIERLEPLLEFENENRKQRRLVAEKEVEDAVERERELAIAAAAKDALSPADALLAEEEKKSKCKAEMSRQKRRLLTSILQQLMSVLNRRERSVRAISEAVQRMRGACVGDQTAFKRALSACVALLQAISARPDDVALRRLRVFHPVLLAQVTGIEGGVALLLAIGFTLKTDLEPDLESTGGRILGVFSSAGGLIANPAVVATAVNVVSDSIERVYSRVEVTIDGNGIFTITTGEDVIIGEKDRENEKENENENEKDEKNENEKDEKNENEKMNEKGIKNGRENGKETKGNDDMVIVDSNDINTIEPQSEEHSSSVKKVLCSSDVSTWSASQQDYSELFYLAKNANNSGISNSSNSSSNNSNIVNKTENESDNLAKIDSKIDNKTDKKVDNKIDKKGDKKGDKIDKSGPVPLLLEMKEPNPETPKGMDEWLAWFDGLKASENAVQDLLSRS